MMLIENKFNLGEYVYLKTDMEQRKRIVTEIKICLDGGMLYSVQSGTENTSHYEKELSKERDYADL